MNTLRTLWIVRHGMRQDFIDQHWRATAERPHDTPLSREGFLQAEETGDRLQGKAIAAIYASPFLRTVQTADVIAGILGLDVNIEHGFCEALKPEWFPRAPDFIPADRLQTTYPSVNTSYRPLLQPTYPEPSDHDTFSRCRQAIHALVDRFPGNLLVVGHGATIDGVITGLTGSNQGMDCRLCAINQLVQDATGDWRLIYSGNEHLSFREQELRFQ